MHITDNDKHSSDMKEQRLEILRKVANGELSPEQAHTELFGLSIVSVSLPSTEEIERVARARFKGRNHTKWKVGMFKAGANWMKSVVIGCSDVVGSKDYVGIYANDSGLWVRAD